MNMATIEVPLDSDLAQIYASANAEERARVQFWVGLLLRDMAQPNRPSLLSTMDAMAREAQQQGLTPEILETLLN